MIANIRFIDKHNNIAVFLAMFGMTIYASLNIFWGFELVDSGFHLTAFENVFDAPGSVTYNFMYYLTNIVGGFFMCCFPSMGIVGFRVLGALFILLSIWIMYLTLKSDIPISHLLLGASIIVICYVKAPYSFNNGIFSCFLYVIAVVSIYKGFTIDNTLLIFFGGFVVGINIFTRIPNVLGVGISLVVLWRKKIVNCDSGLSWREFFMFIGGMLLGVASIFLLMEDLGHTEIFFDCMSVLLNMGSNSENSHGLLSLIGAQIIFWFQNLIPILVFYAVLNIPKEFESSSIISKFVYGVLILFVFWYFYNIDTAYRIIWGMCVVGCLMCLVRCNNNLRLFSVLSLYVLIVEPMGSEFASNHGSLPALLAAPVASLMIIDKINIKYYVVFLLTMLLLIVQKGNYTDNSSIFDKKSTIHGVETEFIFTSKSKAEAINNTMNEIKRFICPKDTLLCFPSAPMMNYLTHTRPAGGHCWITPKGTFVKDIEGTPAILFNKFSSLSDNWPEGGCVRSIRDNYGYDIRSFLLKNNYEKVFENPYFILFLSKSKSYRTL